MAETNLNSSTKTARLAYLDMLKGLSCQMLIYGHTITMHFAEASRGERIAFTLINMAPGLFFFVSGMNVVNFNDRAGRRKDFRPTPFYLLAAVVLFVLSYSYSVNRDSIQLLQIFQGVALTTAFAYVLLRLRLPNTVIVILAFIFYFYWVSRWQMVSADLAQMRGLDPEKVHDIMAPWIEALPPYVRILFLHFSFLPWIAYVLLGAVWMRSRNRHPGRWPWLVFLSLLSPVIGYFSLRLPRWRQPLMLDNVADMLFRNVPVHFFIWLGLIFLVTLASERWYRGADVMKSRLLRWTSGYLELCGKESLTFFIWHWVVLILVHAPFLWLLKAGGMPLAGIAIHGTWIGTILVNALVFPSVVRFGRRWRKRRSFLGEAFAVWFIGTVLGYFALQLPRAQNYSAVALWVSFPACMAFAYFYPAIREILRRRYTIAPAPEAPAQEN